MGLDVSVYKNVKLAPADAEDFDFLAFTLKGFEARCKSLEWYKRYNGESRERTVSYPCSMHGRFRDELSKLIGLSPGIWRDGEVTPETPFFELLEFADNEGCIDWESSAELAKDFEAWHDAAKNELKDYWLGYYQDWLHTFTEAKEPNNVVVFS